MQENYEDITGCRDKPPSDLSLVTTTKLQAYKHESEETTALRRAKSLECIYKVMPDAQMNGATITAQIQDKKFDFYPASDCYFIYSTQKYGFGIEKLCNSIQKKLAI